MVKKFELKPWLSWKKQLDHEITELILKAYKGEIDGGEITQRIGSHFRAPRLRLKAEMA